MLCSVNFMKKTYKITDNLMMQTTDTDRINK